MQNHMASPSLVTDTSPAHLPALLADRARQTPGKTFAEVSQPDGQWQPVTLEEFHGQVRAVAKGLMASGVNAGDRVGILGDTRYEWSVMDFAVLAAGGVTVPIYPSSSPEQVAWIAADAGLRVIAADTDERLDMTAEAVPSSVAALMTPAGLERLALVGAEVTDAELDARTESLTGDDLATIIYTSGTTGRPKGAMLSHANFVVHCENIALDPNFGGFVRGDARLLLFLPLAHVFGRLAMVLSLSAGAVIGYAPSHKTLAADMKSFRPTFMVLVPRVLETIYNKADAAQTGLKRKIFRWSAHVSRDLSIAGEKGRIGWALRAKYAIADKLVLAKVRALMGGQLGYALAGGARLGEDVGHFFRGLGMVVLQGYGLTETTAPAMGTPELGGVMGTVGKPMAGTEMMLAEDGEILLRGVNLFKGYWNAPAETAAVMRDGWFVTGDLGRVENGALTVVGRKKEILVLSSGKNVQPAVLEDAMRSHPAIQDTVVVGDGKHFVSALVALDGVMLPSWLDAHALPPMSIAEAARDSGVRELIRRAIDHANAQVSRAESIREFRILPTSFSEAREELTASFKVRRANVMANYASVVDEIYSKAMPTSQ